MGGGRCVGVGVCSEVSEFIVRFVYRLSLYRSILTACFIYLYGTEMCFECCFCMMVCAPHGVISLPLPGGATIDNPMYMLPSLQIKDEHTSLIRGVQWDSGQSFQSDVFDSENNTCLAFFSAALTTSLDGDLFSLVHLHDFSFKLQPDSEKEHTER